MGVLFPEASLQLQLEPDDFEELKNRILINFGWPSVNVEITDKQLLEVIKNAVMYLNIYAPRRREYETTLNQKQTVYLMPVDRITSIIDVFVSLDYYIALGIPVEVLMKEMAAMNMSRNPQAAVSYITNMASFKFARQIMGLEFSYEMDPPNKIRINPAPYMSTKARFVFMAHHASDLGSLNTYETEWLVRFCIARVSKFIGRIRSKYTGVVLPIGSIDGDGSALISEAREDEANLIEELKGRRKIPEAFVITG